MARIESGRSRDFSILQKVSKQNRFFQHKVHLNFGYRCGFTVAGEIKSN